jgi:hypothetical protein
MNQRRRQRNKSKSLYLWHRYAGLFAALFVIFITITGMALNHTDDLTLKKKHLNVNVLLDLYNVQTPSNVTRFNTTQHSITQADDMLFIGTDNTVAIAGSLIGAVDFQSFSVIALTHTIMLVDSDNQIIETLSEVDGVPARIRKLGIDAQQGVSLLADDIVYQLNDAFVFHPTSSNKPISWSQHTPLSSSDISHINAQYRASIISIETLMLDIHSGRFLGSYGTLFFDFVGIILLFLAFSGIIIWLRQRPKKD